jgi:hypothetical protein
MTRASEALLDIAVHAEQTLLPAIGATDIAAMHRSLATVEQRLSEFIDGAPPGRSDQGSQLIEDSLCEASRLSRTRARLDGGAWWDEFVMATLALISALRTAAVEMKFNAAPTERSVRNN